MRPLKLTISAFAAYKNETVIDFEQLGKRGLYLITGDTGAGKTTVFDAIIYALYGEASGDARKADMLRSMYAEPSVPTFAELVFECRGQVYTARRSPEYMRPKARGEGFTSSPASAQLTKDGQVLAHKSAEMTRKVEEIIGVNRSQFSRIAMIAQGDFLKLLLAKTDERITVFRKLFNTENYNRLQEKIKSDHSELNKEFKALGELIDRYRADERMEDSELAPYYKEAAEMAENAEKLISEKAKLNLAAQKELAGIAAVADEIKGKRDSLAKVKTDIKAAENAKAAAENSFNLAKEKLPAVEADKRRCAEISAVLPRYDELAEKIALKEKRSQEMAVINTNLKNASERLSLIKSQLVKADGEREQLKDCGVLAEKARSGAEKLEREMNELNSLSAKLRKYNFTLINSRKAAEEFMAVSVEYENADRLFRDKETAFLNGQAGVLAMKLERGKPCPVCGSCQHPVPAEMPEDIPTESELETLKKESTRLSEKRREKSVKAGELKGQLEAERNETNSLCMKLLGEDLTDLSGEKAAGLIKEKESLLKMARAREAEMNKGSVRFKQLEKFTDEKIAEQESLSAMISDYEKQLAEKQTELKSCIEGAEKISMQLEFVSRDQAENEIERLERSAAACEAEIENFRSSAENAANRLSSLKGAEKSLEEQLANAEDIDIEAVKEKKTLLEAERRQLDISLKEAAVKAERYRTAFSETERLTAESERLREKLTWLGALNDAANGRGGENGRIMLETHVQTMYFDRVLHKANLRFEGMTGGQYVLVRCTEAENNRSQYGLELDVTDRLNGSRRSVRTLSGGESFKAALSLALGLSDVVRESAGGVRLDSMFIDEGFGSLDSDSLNQALAVLNELGGDDRIVGIVSHVPELKTRIERQIRVTKDKNGCSKADIINI